MFDRRVYEKVQTLQARMKILESLQEDSVRRVVHHRDSGAIQASRCFVGEAILGGRLLEKCKGEDQQLGRAR
eukprot:6492655-Amphidinium_carterae.2